METAQTHTYSSPATPNSKCSPDPMKIKLHGYRPKIKLQSQSSRYLSQQQKAFRKLYPKHISSLHCHQMSPSPYASHRLRDLRKLSINSCDRFVSHFTSLTNLLIIFDTRTIKSHCNYDKRVFYKILSSMKHLTTLTVVSYGGRIPLTAIRKLNHLRHLKVVLDGCLDQNMSCVTRLNKLQTMNLYAAEPQLAIAALKNRHLHSLSLSIPIYLSPQQVISLIFAVQTTTILKWHLALQLYNTQLLNLFKSSFPLDQLDSFALFLIDGQDFKGDSSCSRLREHSSRSLIILILDCYTIDPTSILEGCSSLKILHVEDAFGCYIPPIQPRCGHGRLCLEPIEYPIPFNSGRKLDMPGRIFSQLPFLTSVNLTAIVVRDVNNLRQIQFAINNLQQLTDLTLLVTAESGEDDFYLEFNKLKKLRRLTLKVSSQLESHKVRRFVETVAWLSELESLEVTEWVMTPKNGDFMLTLLRNVVGLKKLKKFTVGIKPDFGRLSGSLTQQKVRKECYISVIEEELKELIELNSFRGFEYLSSRGVYSLSLVSEK